MNAIPSNAWLTSPVPARRARRTKANQWTLNFSQVPVTRADVAALRFRDARGVLLVERPFDNNIR